MNQLKSDSENSATDVSQETLGNDSATGYAETGKQITKWTTNLLATAGVVMIALVAGSHLVSSFGTLTTEADDPPFTTELTNAWPALESCALQFGDSNIELQRDSLRGNREEVIGFLQAKCREVLKQSDESVGELKAKESKLVNDLLKSPAVRSVEQSPGEWRILLIEKDEIQSPLPMVIGIRDNVKNQSTADSSGDDNSASRLAVWGVALPSGPLTNDITDTTGDTGKTGTSDQSPDIEADSQWTSFVGNTVAADEMHQLKTNLIPATARRTLAIAGPNGGTLIGFNGGEITSTKRFFDELAAGQSWKTTQAWRQSGDSWSARFKLPPDSPAQGIQVQINVNHNEVTNEQTVRGILTVQSRQPENHPG